MATAKEVYNELDINPADETKAAATGIARRIYQVRGADNETEALNASGLPRYGASHPRLQGLYARRLTIKPELPGGDRKTWAVTVAYEANLTDDPNEPVDPETVVIRLPTPRVEFMTETNMVPFENGWNATGELVAVVNSLGERPNPPIMVPARVSVVAVTVYYLQPNLVSLLNLQGTTNNSAIRIGGVSFPKHGGILRKVSPAAYDVGVPDVNAWSITYEFVKQSAYKEFWNMSYYQKAQGEALTPILDGEGNPVVEPQHITTGGVPTTSDAQRNLLRFRYLPESNWSSLGLPSQVYRSYSFSVNWL